MAYEHQEGFGNFFVNKKKEEGTKQPDYKGEFLLQGKLWEIAGWKKAGAKGPYLSLKVQEPREKEEAAPNSTKKNKDDPW